MCGRGVLGVVLGMSTGVGLIGMADGVPSMGVRSVGCRGLFDWLTGMAVIKGRTVKLNELK